MAYNPKTDWQNSPVTTTPITATELIRIEQGLAVTSQVADAAQAAAATNATAIAGQGSTITGLQSSKAPVNNPSFTGLVTAAGLKVTGGSPGTGKVFTSDVDGVGTWQTPGSGAGVVDATYPRTVLVATGTEQRPVGSDVILWVDTRDEATRPDNMGDYDLWFTLAGSPPTGDVTAPSVPTGLASSSITGTSFTVSWSAATDDTAVTGYQVRLNGGTAISEPTTSHSFTGLTSSPTNTDYAVQVRARDAAGNWSEWSTGLTVTTPGEVSTPSPLSRFNFAEGSGGTATAVSGGYTVTDMTGGSPVWGSGTLKSWMRGYVVGSTGAVLTEWSAAFDFTLNAAPGAEGSFWLKDGSVQTYFNITPGRAVKVYGAATTTSTDLVSLGSPHRLVVTQDTTTLKVYLDGTEIISATEHRDFERTLNNLNYGSLNWDLDTFRVWNVALTPSQVTGLGA